MTVGDNRLVCQAPAGFSIGVWPGLVQDTFCVVPFFSVRLFGKSVLLFTGIRALLSQLATALA